MEWVETTGPTVAAAREAALDELGVDERDAELVVVAEPRSGLFGFGKVDARVRARVRPAAPRPKRSPRRRGEDRGRGRGGERRAASGDKTPPTSDGAAAGRRRRARSGTADGAPVAAEDRSAPAARREPAEGAPGATSRRRRSGTGGRDGAARADASEPADRADRANRTDRSSGKSAERATQRPEAVTEETEMTIEEQAAAVERFVAGVVERFGFDQATTSVRVEDDHVFVDVAGADLGLLIGPRGRTLDALQELARTVVQRRGEEGMTRVVVDVAGFRAKRAAALEAFVRRIAEEVAERGEPQALEAMSAADRKIVHDTVTAIEGVHTSSEGAEPHRYVVVHPGSTAAEQDAGDA